MFSKSVSYFFWFYEIWNLINLILIIAKEAKKNVQRKSQAIIILGETGSGKTETAKRLTNFLCVHSSEGELVKFIAEAGAILDALGNSKTIRNKNSSRYGKFTKVFSY